MSDDRDDPYQGWTGTRANPNAPAGGGGLGFFRSSRPLGKDIDPLSDIPHPLSRIVLAQNIAVPKKAATDLPGVLDKFTEGIGTYTAAELNDALLTVFGEISPVLIAELEKEARAVASTIYNRLSRIEKARTAYVGAKAELDKTKSARQEAESAFNELARNPSKHKNELGKEQFDANLTAAKKKYNEATHALGIAQISETKALSEKEAAESYVAQSKRNREDLTLTDIVEQVAQYQGYPKGTSDCGNYPKMLEPDKKRNLQRWKTAKTAVSDLATTPAQRDSYEQFRSNQGGKHKPLKGRTRIGGNDFW